MLILIYADFIYIYIYMKKKICNIKGALTIHVVIYPKLSSQLLGSTCLFLFFLLFFFNFIFKLYIIVLVLPNILEKNII